MELTPEERERIYLEEKARLEIRQALEKETMTLQSPPVPVRPRPSDGVAAVLSLFIPGAGQIYKGRTGGGILWLIFTVFGYLAMIVPGLILHLICIFHAASVEPAAESIDTEPGSELSDVEAPTPAVVDVKERKVWPLLMGTEPRSELPDAEAPTSAAVNVTKGRVWGLVTKDLTRNQQRWILGAIAAIVAGVLLLATLSMPRPPESSTTSPRSIVGSGASQDPVFPTGVRTPLQDRVRVALERAEEAKRSDAVLPDRVRKAEIGVITTIVGPGTSWPCSPSKVALKEMMKWQKAMLDEQAPDSVMNNLSETLGRTRSIMVEPRERVKILDKEPSIRRVSVIEQMGTNAPAYMTVTARACWVAAEAVVR
jgi:hypothetical protein